jgi:hypothetical protein
MANPIPRLEPVTRATCPANGFAGFMTNSPYEGGLLPPFAPALVILSEAKDLSSPIAFLMDGENGATFLPDMPSYHCARPA